MSMRCAKKMWHWGDTELLKNTLPRPIGSHSRSLSLQTQKSLDELHIKLDLRPVDRVHGYCGSCVCAWSLCCGIGLAVLPVVPELVMAPLLGEFTESLTPTVAYPLGTTGRCLPAATALGLFDLPSELLEAIIFDTLDPRDIASLALSCKRLSSHSVSPALAAALPSIRDRVNWACAP